MPDLLCIENLRAGYGEAVVLPNMSLRLPESQVLALLGRNGTGKTTLINSIVGVTRCFGGAIALEGADITLMRPDQRAFAQGITHAFSRFGNAATPPVIAALIVAFSWRASFYVLGAASLLWAGLWWFYFRDDPRKHPDITPQDLEGLPPSTVAATQKQIPWGPLLKRMLPVTLSAFLPFMAASTVSAITPTPTGSGTILTTPLTAFAAASSMWSGFSCCTSG